MDCVVVMFRLTVLVCNELDALASVHSEAITQLVRKCVCACLRLTVLVSNELDVLASVHSEASRLASRWVTSCSSGCVWSYP